MHRPFLGLILLVAVLALTASCGEGKQLKVEVTDLTLGTGRVALPGDSVVFDYSGTLEDGTTFDASQEPFKTRIDALIPGLQKSLPGMRVLGERRIVVPPELAYGERGRPGNIPPNSTLTFDIFLEGIILAQPINPHPTQAAPTGPASATP